MAFEGPRRLGARALACLSLLQSLEVLDRHFSLGKTEHLAELEETMVAILTESVAAAG